MNVDVIKPTKKINPDILLLKISSILGVILAINGGGYIINEMTKSEDLGTLLGHITFFCIFEAATIMT